MRDSRSVGGGLALSLLVLAAVWVASRPEVERGTARETHEASAPADAPAAPAAVSPVQPPSAEASARVDAFAELPVLEGSGAAELEVRVVLDGAPAPRAELWFVDWERHPSGWDPLFVPPPNRDEERMALGARFTADAQGRARLPPARGAAALLGRLGDAYGERELDGEPGPVVLELRHDPPLRVHVREESGEAAAGVPVVLREAGGEDVCYQATTDAEGNARLFARGARGRLGASGTARVALALLLREPVEVSVALGGDEPVELVVPATGSVELELLDERGRPWPGPTRFRLGLSERGELELGEAARNACGFDRRVEEGRVRFERVGLGLALVAAAATTTVADESLRAFAGPRAAGERVPVVLHLPAPSPSLVGRVLDAERRPLGSAQVRLSLAMGRGGRGGVVASDAAGRFRWVSDFEPEQVEHVEVEVLAPFESQGFARLDGVRLVRGENDLGELVLAPTPFVVAGHVQDERGEPVRGAKLTLFAGARPGVRYSGRKLDVEPHTDALGRFACRRLVSEAVVGIVVEADGFAAGEATIVPVGTTDAELVLQHGGTIGFELRVVGDLWPNVELLQTGRKVPTRTTLATPGYVLGPVPPGTYTLRLFYPWSEARHALEGIEVVAGQETLLPPIDLRAFLPVVALTVVDELDSAVEGVKVALRRADAQPRLVHASSDGERWLVAPGALPAALLVEAPGFRPLELDGVDSDRRVVLHPGPRLRFELDGALPELPPDWHWTAWLEAREPSPMRFGASHVDLAPGVQELRVQRAGAYGLSFGVVRRLGDEPEDRRFGEGLELDLTDEDGGVVRLAAPSAELVAEVRAHIEETENQ